MPSSHTPATRRPPPGRRAVRAAGRLAAMALGVALLLAPGAAHAQAAGAAERPALPGLVDGRGEPYDVWSADKGWRLMYFGFTHCPEICPTSLFEMTAALDLVAERERRLVTPVFATVDPARDTPEVMSRYVSPLGYPFVTLTGPTDTMQRLAWRYGIIAVRAGASSGGSYSVDHSSLVLLVDPSGEAVERFPYAMTYEEVARRVEARLKGAPLPPA